LATSYRSCEASYVTSLCAHVATVISSAYSRLQLLLQRVVQEQLQTRRHEVLGREHWHCTPLIGLESMRILLINQTWFSNELRSLGHEVLSVGNSRHLDHVTTGPIMHIDQLLRSLPNGFTPDRIVWLDNSAPMGVVGIEDCDIPTLFYSIDTHHHYVIHSHLASCFDHTLVAQKDFIPDFEALENPATWFPLWASETMESSTEKKYGAVFVGTLNPALNPERVEFFERLKKLVPIEVLTGYFPSIFPFAEIVVNQTVKGDLNFRVFEAMMSGALLLTEARGHGLFELFKDGEHLVSYKPRDVEEAAAKIQYLLANPATMREIAARGRAEILAKHCAIHRAQALESILLKLTKRPKAARRHYAMLIEMYAISSLLSKVNPAYSREVLILALTAARKGLKEGAKPSSLEVSYIVRTCLMHDVRESSSEGNVLVFEFAGAYPDLQLFTLLKIRSLLNQGRVQEATNAARAIASHVPLETVFSIAEEAAACILDERLEESPIPAHRPEQSPAT